MAERDRLIPRPDAAERCLVSARTLVRWAKEGIGPKPIKVGPRRVGYSEREIERWLDECRSA